MATCVNQINHDTNSLYLYLTNYSEPHQTFVLTPVGYFDHYPFTPYRSWAHKSSLQQSHLGWSAWRCFHFFFADLSEACSQITEIINQTYLQKQNHPNENPGSPKNRTKPEFLKTKVTATSNYFHNMQFWSSALSDTSHSSLYWYFPRSCSFLNCSQKKFNILFWNFRPM